MPRCSALMQYAIMSAAYTAIVRSSSANVIATQRDLTTSFLERSL
jgi:hypothetical protein